jgi:hypothetical protein
MVGDGGVWQSKTGIMGPVMSDGDTMGEIRRLIESFESSFDAEGELWDAHGSVAEIGMHIAASDDASM